MLSRTLRRFKTQNEFDIAHLNDNIEMVDYPRQEQTNKAQPKEYVCLPKDSNYGFVLYRQHSLITERRKKRI